MGWRDKIDRWASDEYENDGYAASLVADQIKRVIMEMPAPDRIAMARELLEGTGRVVAPKKPTAAMLDAGEEDEREWRRMPRPRVRLALHWEAMVTAVEPAP